MSLDRLAWVGQAWRQDGLGWVGWAWVDLIVMDWAWRGWKGLDIWRDFERLDELRPLEELGWYS